MKSKKVLVLTMLGICLLLAGVWAMPQVWAGLKLLLSFAHYAYDQTQLARVACPPIQTFVPNTYHLKDTETNSKQQLIVVYLADCTSPNRPTTTLVGLQVYDGLSYAGNSMSGADILATGPNAPGLTYSYGGSGGPDGYTLVMGQVNISQAATVEVLFADGKTRGQAPSNHQYFILAPGTSLPCELRVLDGNQIVLIHYQIGQQMSANSGYSGTCPP